MLEKFVVQEITDTSWFKAKKNNDFWQKISFEQCSTENTNLVSMNSIIINT
jgi:hypothetical protein